MFERRQNRKFAVRKAKKSLEIPRKSHEKSHENQIVKECECVLNYKWFYEVNQKRVKRAVSTCCQVLIALQYFVVICLNKFIMIFGTRQFISLIVYLYMNVLYRARTIVLTNKAICCLKIEYTCIYYLLQQGFLSSVGNLY